MWGRGGWGWRCYKQAVAFGFVISAGEYQIQKLNRGYLLIEDAEVDIGAFNGREAKTDIYRTMWSQMCRRCIMPPRAISIFISNAVTRMHHAWTSSCKKKIILHA
jgi:hypothetical protein